MVMLVPGIYWIGVERVIQKASWIKISRTIFIVMAILGVIIIIISKMKGNAFQIGVSLLIPLYHFYIYHLFRNIFIKAFKREPRDVAFNFDKGFVDDRFFALVFVLFSVFSGMVLTIWAHSIST
jgi:hypothetical protein